MQEEMQNIVTNTAREACKKHHDGELKYYKTMAIYVKEQLDKKLGGSWHICVGKLHFSFKSISCSSASLTLGCVQVQISGAIAHTRLNIFTYSG